MNIQLEYYNLEQQYKHGFDKNYTLKKKYLFHKEVEKQINTRIKEIRLLLKVSKLFREKIDNNYNLNDLSKSDIILLKRLFKSTLLDYLLDLRLDPQEQKRLRNYVDNS